MKRRTALTAVASSLGATAGCLGLLPSRPDGPLGGGADDQPTATTAATTEGAGEPTETGSGDETATNGERTESGDDGTQNGSSAVIKTCPSSVVESVNVEETVCNGEGTDADIYLAAESEEVSPPGSIVFTLRNLIGRSQLYSPCGWALYERSNEDWEAVQPLEEDMTQKSMLGGFETLTLYIGQEPPTDTGKCPYTLNDPSPGLYLFGVEVFREEGLLILASFEVTE